MHPVEFRLYQIKIYSILTSTHWVFFTKKWNPESICPGFWVLCFTQRGWVAEDVVKELGDNEGQKVQATIQFKVNGFVNNHAISYASFRTEEKKATFAGPRSGAVA